MARRPVLLSVRIIPWEIHGGLYGIACEYDDNVETREPWGTYHETQVAVSLRQRDIVSAINFKRA